MQRWNLPKITQVVSDQVKIPTQETSPRAQVLSYAYHCLSIAVHQKNPHKKMEAAEEISTYSITLSITLHLKISCSLPHLPNTPWPHKYHTCYLQIHQKIHQKERGECTQSLGIMSH